MIDHISELSFLISRLALITRQFQLSYTQNYSAFDTIAEFQLLINNTMIQQSNLLTDYNSGSDCEVSNSIIDDVIPYITSDSPYIVQYTNLYAFTGKIISNVINI